VGNDLFRIIPTPNYDLHDEHWEFPPGSIVRAETMEYAGKKYLLAVRHDIEDPSVGDLQP
jgi:hypothetical protein